MILISQTCAVHRNFGHRAANNLLQCVRTKITEESTGLN